MKIKTTLYIQAIKWRTESDFSIETHTFHRESDNTRIYIDIAEQEIELDIPELSDSELTEKHVEELQKMRVQVLADNHWRLQKVDDEIASLLALESK